MGLRRPDGTFELLDGSVQKLQIAAGPLAENPQRVVEQAQREIAAVLKA